MYQVTNKSTVNGVKTPFGNKTPHRFPVNPTKNLVEVFMNLIRQLYPTGRAWFLKVNSVFFNLHLAINRSFIRIIEDSKFTIDSIFPDNENFSIEDAALWEFRFGLVTNNFLSLEDRKKAILRKMAYPSNIKARQHRSFIESQLQKAGFNVWVHENTPPYKTPEDIVSLFVGATQHGPPTQHGAGTQHGSVGFNIVANLSTQNESYTIGAGNIWASFFIGGEILGSPAEVQSARLIEFKELILKLKPAHTVAFLFVNFV